MYIYEKIKNIIISGSNRSSKAKINMLYMLIIKGISLIISLLYVPLLLHSMSEDNYGIWLTLTSIVSWVAMCDIGLGNGMRNRLTEAIAHNDYGLGKKYISTAYMSISILMCALLLVYFIISNFISWNSILNAPNIPQNEINQLVNIVFITFCINFVLSLLNSILLALQSPAISSAITTIGQLLSFISVLIAVKIFNESSLLILGSLISIIPVFVLLFSTIIIFLGRYRNLSPSIKFIDFKKLREILTLGIKFFVLQIITIILYQSNNIIITHIVNSQAVVEYNIAFKYMNVLLMIYTIIVTPLWSATTDAYVKGDIVWIKNVVKKMNIIALMFISIGLLMVIFSNSIYCIWLNISESKIDIITTILIYIYIVGNILYANYGYILNGIGKLNLQLAVTSIMALAYIPISCLFGSRYGLHGILSVFALVAIINFIWSKIQLTKIISGDAHGIWNK